MRLTPQVRFRTHVLMLVVEVLGVTPAFLAYSGWRATLSTTLTTYSLSVAVGKHLFSAAPTHTGTARQDFGLDWTNVHVGRGGQLQFATIPVARESGHTGTRRCIVSSAFLHKRNSLTHPSCHCTCYHCVPTWRCGFWGLVPCCRTTVTF